MTSFSSTTQSVMPKQIVGILPHKTIVTRDYNCIPSLVRVQSPGLGFYASCNGPGGITPTSEPELPDRCMDEARNHNGKLNKTINFDHR